MGWSEPQREWIVKESPAVNEVIIYPINNDGRDKNWRWSQENVKNDYTQFLAKTPINGTPQIYYKYRSKTVGTTPLTLWTDSKFSATEHGTKKIKELFGESLFTYPKSLYAVEESIKVCGAADFKNCLILDYFSGSGTTGHATINLNREDGGSRDYILVEIGEYFDTVLKPRIKKVVFSKNWKNGKPSAEKDGNYNGISHFFKYVRLESYEDVLDNLQLNRTEQQSQLLDNPANESLKEDYLLKYMLDIEAKGSLLSPDLFIDPFNAQMRIVRESETRNQKIDMVETFNYLLGLRLQTMQTLKGIVEVVGESPNGESVLVIWRNQNNTDNDGLDEWFRKQSYNTRDMEFDLVYVNGDNNLPNVRTGEESWKVQLIEDVFQALMFDCKDV